MKRLRLFFLELLSSIMSGVLGGLTAGLIFGLVLRVSSFFGSGDRPDSLFDFVFPEIYLSVVIGLIGGLFLGTVVGFTLPLTRPYLARISQVLGGIAAVVPTLLLIKNSNMPPYAVGIILSVALVAGITGGTVAFKFYTKIYE